MGAQTGSFVNEAMICLSNGLEGHSSWQAVQDGIRHLAAKTDKKPTHSESESPLGSFDLATP